MFCCQNRPKKILFSSRLEKAKKMPNGQIILFLENCFKKGQMATLFFPYVLDAFLMVPSPHLVPSLVSFGFTLCGHLVTSSAGKSIWSIPMYRFGAIIFLKKYPLYRKLNCHMCFKDVFAVFFAQSLIHFKGKSIFRECHMSYSVCQGSWPS